MQILAVFLIVSIVSVIAAFTSRDIVKFAAARQRCGHEFGVNSTLIARATAGEMINDPKFDCFMACILERMNLITDGKLDVNSAMRKVPDADYRDGLVGAIKACADRQGRDKCETANRIFICMHEKGVPRMLNGP